MRHGTRPSRRRAAQPAPAGVVLLAGESHHEVIDRQQFVALVFEPLGGGVVLA